MTEKGIGMRASNWLLGASVILLLTAGGIFLFATGGAQAGTASDEAKALVAFIESGAASNLRLCALNDLKALDEDAVEAELEKIAKGDDLFIATFATTTLGRRKTTAARKSLKSLLENTSLDTDVRMGALTAIAVHFKDKDDIEYLELKTDSDSKLKARCAWLKTNVYKVSE